MSQFRKVAAFCLVLGFVLTYVLAGLDGRGHCSGGLSASSEYSESVSLKANSYSSSQQKSDSKEDINHGNHFHCDHASSCVFIAHLITDISRPSPSVRTITMQNRDFSESTPDSLYRPPAA